MINKEISKTIFDKANLNNTLCLFCFPNKEMIIFESDNFYVLRNNFPVSLGHIMISSKEHFGSMGELELDLFDELIKIKNALKKWHAYNELSCLFFEHGRAGSCHSSQEHGDQCEHFHLNCITSEICLHQDLKQEFTKNYSIISISDICDLFAKWGDYLYFENCFSEKAYYPLIQKTIPPHYLRTLICKHHNTVEKADWKKHQSLDDFHENHLFTKSLGAWLKREFE